MFIVVIIIVVLLIINLLKKKNSSQFEKQKYINAGFANIEDPYTMPVVKLNIVTPQEAQHILDVTKNKFKDSLIIGGMDTNIRKSQTTWLYRSDPIIYNITKRICEQYNYPIENAEPLQVVKYKPGGFYNDHHDSCCDDDEKCNDFVQEGGQRVLTVLIYLNDDFEGGGTQFSEINEIIKPPKYGGIIFRPMANDSNKCHPLGLHKGMPVKSGVKYVCNLWIREGVYK